MSGRRPNGTGSVYRRGDRWAAKMPKDGAGFHYVPGTFRLKREAQDALNVAIARISAGQPVKDSSVTVSAFAADFCAGPLLDSGRAPNTVAQYRSLLNGHAVPALGHLPLRDVRGKHVEALLAKIGRTLAASSVRSLAYALKAMFAVAVRDKVLATSPMVGVKIPTAQADEPPVLDSDQLAALLDSAAADPLWPFWLAAILTGARRGELLGLRWVNVDLDTRVARISESRTRVHGFGIVTGPTKNRQNRSVSLPGPLVDALRKLHARQAADRLAAGDAYENPGGLVFVGQLGHGLDPRMITRRTRALLESHGLTGANLGPHLLRHSTISVLLSDGHAPAAVSKLAGHSSTRVTLTTYAHALKQDEVAITASLGRLSGG